MIPRIKTGKSFKGAALYYLHDKHDGESGAKPTTSERVGFTHTINCFNDDAQEALREMRDTFFMQDWLRQQSGHATGRRIKNAVMTVSLSWPKDQSPDRAEMMEAVYRYLEHMKWLDHQAVVIQHTDTQHPHLHMIINRVHHETGMAIDDNWSKLRSSEWALEWEQAHGKIYCEERLKRHRDRGDGFAHEAGQKRAARHYADWKAANDEMNKEGIFALSPEEARAAEWASLKNDQKMERMDFWQQTSRERRELRDAIYTYVKSEMAPAWQHHMQEQAKAFAETQKRAEEISDSIHDLHKEARRYQRHMRQVMGHRVEKPADFEDRVAALKEQRRTLWADHKAEWKEKRDALKAEMKSRIEELSAPALEAYKHDRDAQYEELLARQREGKAELREDQKDGRPRLDLLSAYQRPTANENTNPKAPCGANDNSDPSTPMPQHAINAAAIDRLNARQQQYRRYEPYIARGLDTIARGPIPDQDRPAQDRQPNPLPAQSPHGLPPQERLPQYGPRERHNALPDSGHSDMVRRQADDAVARSLARDKEQGREQDNGDRQRSRDRERDR